jgi:hypothetical protein
MLAACTGSPSPLLLKAQDGDGRDELYGGPGFDICYIDEGDFTRGCDEVALAIE